MNSPAYSITVTVPPVVEPVSLADAKLFLRDAPDEDDELVAGLIVAARELTEQDANRAWVNRTVTVKFAAFPAAEVRLPLSPVSAVTAVRYRDTVGTLTTLDAAGWQTWLDHVPPLLAPAPRAVWPGTEAGRMGGVEVDVTAGYGATAAAVPRAAVTAVKLCVGHWYANRGDGRDPHEVAESLGVPAAATRLLNSLRTGGYR